MHILCTDAQALFSKPLVPELLHQLTEWHASPPKVPEPHRVGPKQVYWPPKRS